MHSHTFEVTETNFQAQVLQADVPVLVEFGADWCPPCKMLAPAIKTLAEKYQGKLNVGVIDSDANPDLVMQYGVMGLPTLLLFRGGEVAQRWVGFQPRERIEAQIVPFLQTEKA